MSAAPATKRAGLGESVPAAWADISARAPELALTMRSYLSSLAERLSPRSVEAAGVGLRQFARYLIGTDPTCQSIRDVRADHVAGFRTALAEGSVTSTCTPAGSRTIEYRIATLRRFFEDLTEAGSPDAPAEMAIPALFHPRRQSAPQPPKPPKRRRPKPPSRALPRETTWEEIAGAAPRMAATMAAYIEQLGISQRPASAAAASLALRHLAAHLVASDASCLAVADIGRAHIEAYKVALAARPGQNGPLSKTTIRHNLGMLRTFFERIIDWDWEDAPRRVPIFVGDIPKADEPLPRFLDDPRAAKFMATLAVDPDRRRRLLVELLARTGMRAGELGGLRDDAMYRVGDTWWLRIPIGKLHNDRNVPLHPLLVGLITDYQTWRGPSRNGFLLERDDGKPFDRRTIHRYVESVARRAGVGHVHPHQLRHTLATQCLNRGMSLEAIAALLGHRSPRMTLVYARISDTNVADQYFNATRAVEADAVSLSTSDDHEGTVEHRRLLGNGHCTRPLELDCRFQTICEGCGFYETGAEFVDILRRQRDDATAHADLERTNLYDQLVKVIDASAGP
ncbi:MAG TPA: site-specific integrase [Acidimicrobiales bacterium]|nr:site-specific integrase [Acidimicrobiales bacterium]